MTKAELKTKPTTQSVKKFITSIPDIKQRRASESIQKLFEKITREKPKLWGSSIVGFGNEHLKYESGRELDWFKVGFSPRKSNLVLYVLKGGAENYQELLKTLGKHSTGKGCLYIKNIDDIDLKVLSSIIKKSLGK